MDDARRQQLIEIVAAKAGVDVGLRGAPPGAA